MSSKQQSKTVKLPAKEMIVTRYKSAQQKRQLRNKDRSMKSITQLLKSPNSARRKKTKISQKSPKKPPHRTAEVCSPSVSRKLQLDSNEYKPNTLKRTPKPKKVWLQPKHEMRMVARTNKRKLCTPQKGMKSPPLETNIRCYSEDHSPVYSELSMSEVVRLVEDTGQLEDEDLMEILTCPSPVWWEDPPEPWYTEKPLLRSSSPIETNNKLKQHNTNSDVDNKLTNTQNKKVDLKFNRKRLKLEKLLDNIRKRSNDNDKCVKKDFDVNKNCDLKQIRPTDEVTYNNDRTVSPHRTNEKRDSDSTEEYLSDISVHDDILKNLEEFDIPMEPPNFGIEDTTDNNVINELENSLDASNDLEKYLKTTVIDKHRPNLQNPNVIPKELPALKKYTLSNVQSLVSPLSVKSSDDTSSNDRELDTISDTNIKYLIDNDEITNNHDITDSKNSKNDDKEVIDDTSKIILDKIKEFFVKNGKNKFKSNAIDNKEEIIKDTDSKKYITVYKIISDEGDDVNSTVTDCVATKEVNIDSRKDEKPTDLERIEKNKCQLNSFYKKCKSIHRRKNDSDFEACSRKDKNSMVVLKRNIDVDVGASKTIVSNGSMKYCFKCSSIFEIENDFCNYCNRNQKSGNDRTKNSTVMTP